MKKQILLLFVLAITSAYAYSQPLVYQTEKRPSGFASASGEGVTEVNGGEGGQVFYVQTGAELETIMGR